MEIGDYLSIAKRWWWTLLVATWIAALAGFLVASRMQPTYEASANLLVGPINTDINTLKASGELVQTYATLTTSQPIVQSVIQDLGLSISPSRLQADIHALANNTTRFLTIKVDQPKPADAARIANALANQMVTVASKGTTRPEGQLQITDPAEPPTSPIAPQVGLIVVLAATAGLLGAIVMVLLVEYFSETVRTREDLLRLAPVPLLATVGGARSGFGANSGVLAVESAPTSRLAATLRLLSAKITYVDGTRQASSILIAACQPGDNVAEVAANVAASIAMSGRQVTLIDTDPAGPGVTEQFGLEGQPGLSDALASGGGLARYAGSETLDLPVLPRGTGALADDIEAETASRLLTALNAKGGVVVIAGGAISTSAASLTWARIADVAVLVVDRDRTRRDNVSYAVETLRLVRANLVGTVLSLRHPRRVQRRVTGRARALVGSPVAAHGSPSSREAPQAAAPRTAEDRPARTTPRRRRSAGPDAGTHPSS